MTAPIQHGNPEHVAIFSSPRAGSGAGREEIPRLLDQLNAYGFHIRTCHSASQLEQWCVERRSDLEPSKATVVAAGGDGTITLAASIMQTTDTPIAAVAHPQKTASPQAGSICLLPMPLGTENLLAKHFGHQATAAEVKANLQHGQRASLDMGMVRRIAGSTPLRGKTAAKPMLTMVSCGFDADVVRQVHLKRKGHIHRLNYFRPILHAMRSYQFPELSVELLDANGSLDRQLKGGWAMVFNLPRYGGGLKIEPDAIGDDGWLDVIVFQGRSCFTGLKYLALIKSGRHLDHPEITRVKAQRIRITSDQRVHYQIDGDYVSRLPIEISAHPKAIELLIP